MDTTIHYSHLTPKVKTKDFSIRITQSTFRHIGSSFIEAITTKVNFQAQVEAMRA